MKPYENEAEVVRDAVYIFDGACNPVAVSGALHEAIRFYGKAGWDNCKGKDALILMVEQLAHLLGTSTSMAEVISAYRRLKPDDPKPVEDS